MREAKAWRQEAQVALRRAQLNAPSRRLVHESASDWLEAARAGVVRTRSGDRYKPAAIRTYDGALKHFILPVLGERRLSAVTRNQIQDIVDRLVAEGRAPSTVKNAILPLRAIYRRAVHREEVVVNPTLGLSLPSDRRRRDRIARPREALEMLAALPERDRALWATALYAGLRRGELAALRWSVVDLEAGIIEVRKSWDRVAGLVEPKSRSGERRVPLPAILRKHLLEHRLRQGTGGKGFVFSADGERPYDLSPIAKRARKIWLEADLRPLCLHDCRHTYAAFMIAAAVNAKALSTYMGHSSITVTLDRYGHLMPGNERQAAKLLDRFIDEAEAADLRSGAVRLR